MKTFKQKTNSGLITKEGYDLSDLSPTELFYFKQIYLKTEALYLISKPGIGLLISLRNIADKITKVEIIKDVDGIVDVEKSGKIVARSMYYLDLRMYHMDNSDMGISSNKKEITDNVVPRWAYYTNNPPKKKNSDVDPLPYCGTIINFEDLHRAPSNIKDVAYQILLDRKIGIDFWFNENVFMVATGGLINGDLEYFDKLKFIYVD